MLSCAPLWLKYSGFLSCPFPPKADLRTCFSIVVEDPPLADSKCFLVVNYISVLVFTSVFVRAHGPSQADKSLEK